MKVHNCSQYSPEWWEVRRGVPTASEATKIITPAKWQLSSQAEGYACDLVAQHYDHDYGPQDEYITAAMRNGRIKEPASRRFYEFETNRDVVEVGFVTTDDGRFGCSPDALCGDDGGLELKNPTAATHVRWLCAGVVPPEYLPQVHFSLLVTKREWWDFMSYYAGLPPLLLRVVPDDKTLKLAEALESFWEIYQGVKAKVQPYVPDLAVSNGAALQPYF